MSNAQGFDGTSRRAYELAAESRSVAEIQAKLKSEGFDQVDAHLAGRKIKSELRTIIGQQR
jgi:hypothetical protein